MADGRRVRHVLVLGGGVVGLSTAYFLRKWGADVTVLERDRVGSGASRGNAGEVCPSLASPLPAPGIVGHGLRNMTRPDAALYIAPQPSARLAEFLTLFARNSTLARHVRGWASMWQGLGKYTFRLFDELASDGVAASRIDRGYLYVYGSRETARRELASYSAISRFGGEPPQQLLSPRDLGELEPCLAGTGAYGFLLQGHWTLNPSEFVDSLTALLAREGVTFVEGARVTGVDETTDGVVAQTYGGSHHADAAVISCGVWSRDLCARLGVRAPLFPGKGYSFSVPVDPRPSRLLKLEDAHVAATPLGSTTRVAGTMELDPRHDRFNRRRIDAIVRAARPYLPTAKWDRISEEWMAPRPMTPDGLPLVGAIRDNVYLAAGHNMLGFMLSPATGRAVTDLIAAGRTRANIAPFDPLRFTRRGQGDRAR